MKKNKIPYSLNFYNVKLYNNVCCIDHKIMKTKMKNIFTKMK